jgi:hypothetical protein
MKAKKLKRPKDTPEKQHARFVEAAKHAEVDLTAFDREFKRLDLRKKPPKSG